MAQNTYIARKGFDADFAAVTCDSLVVNTATVEAGSIVLKDDESITIGTGSDVQVLWDSTNLIVKAAADESVIEIGDAAATQKSFDLKWYANEANGASYLYADASANLIYSTGVDLQFKDADLLVFGTGSDVTVQWDSTNLIVSAAADDSVIEIGDSAEAQKSFDVKIYGNAASGADYLYWDASASKMISAGAACMQIGETTTGVSVAGGTTMIYGYAAQKSTALTGTLRGVHGNAVALVASADGTAEGVLGRAANAASATDVTGCNLDTARGGSFLVVGAGLSTAGPAVLEHAHAIYGQLDIDAANLTVSDARGLYINVQSGNASANTLTACDLAYLEYESVVGTAPAINSAIKIAGVGGYTAATTLIDASTFKTAIHDTDQVTLFKFLNAAGAVVTCSYDSSESGSFVFATAS